MGTSDTRWLRPRTCWFWIQLKTSKSVCSIALQEVALTPVRICSEASPNLHQKSTSGVMPCAVSFPQGTGQFASPQSTTTRRCHLPGEAGNSRKDIRKHRMFFSVSCLCMLKENSPTSPYIPPACVLFVWHVATTLHPTGTPSRTTEVVGSVSAVGRSGLGTKAVKSGPVSKGAKRMVCRF